MNAGKLNIGTDDGVTQALLGPSVKLVQCKYECGGYFVVTDRKREAPHHFECAVKAALECQRQMRAKSGPYYDKWLTAMWDNRQRAAMGLQLAIERLKKQQQH